MPELPEVETIIRTLRPALLGKNILSADLLWKPTLVSPSPAKFQTVIRGQQIQDIFRLAKFLQI